MPRCSPALDARAGVGWLTPLNTARPTVAEFLKDRGYATVGFVANTAYTASDSGLARGFTEYHDFIFPEADGLQAGRLDQSAPWLDCRRSSNFSRIRSCS